MVNRQCISIDNNYNPATFSKNLRENRNYVGMIFGKSKFQMQKFRFRNISRVFQFRFSKNHSDIFTSCAWSHAKCCRIIIVVEIEPQSSFLNLEAKMKKKYSDPNLTNPLFKINQETRQNLKKRPKWPLFSPFQNSQISDFGQFSKVKMWVFDS